MPINLNNCKPGDELLSKHGTVLTYQGKNEDKFTAQMYPHVVRYPNGGRGTRTDDGHVMRLNRLPSDEDIVEILS